MIGIGKDNPKVRVRRYGFGRGMGYDKGKFSNLHFQKNCRILTGKKTC